MKYVIVDLETRTFDIEKGGIYQVGLVATDEEFNILETKEISIVQNIEELYKGYGHGYRKISKIRSELCTDGVHRYSSCSPNCTNDHTIRWPCNLVRNGVEK